MPGRVGAWTLDEKLGSGNFGSVYAGHRIRLDGRTERAAIKIVPLADGAAQTLEREVEVLTKVDSPYVARVIDAGRESTAANTPSAWVASEIIKGDNLEDEIILHGPLDLAQWWELAHDLLAAAASIHSAGVVHLDIKPDNVMRFSRRSVLVDFGIASFASFDDINAFARTSLVCAAPEQLNGTIKAQANPYAADLFAIGMVLVFAGTGHSAWQLRELLDHVPQAQRAPALYSLMTSRPARLDGLTSEQILFVTPLLSIEPNRRGYAADHLRQALMSLPATSARRAAAVEAEPASVASLIENPRAVVDWLVGKAPAPATPVPGGAKQAAQTPAPGTPLAASSRSFRVTWLLSLLVGVFGVDRFYLGKVGTGLLKLFTAGGMLIWYIYDLYLLLTNQATDREGKRVLYGGQNIHLYRRLTVIFAALFVVYVIISSIVRSLTGQ